MTNERKAELFHEMLVWIYDHTKGYGIDEYIGALSNCGFTQDEIREDLSDFLDEDELKEIFED